MESVNEIYLSEKIEKLESENERIKRLLHDLTPGGSEFYNDPEYCAKWVRESRENTHYILSGMVRDLKQVIRELIAFGELEDLTFTNERATKAFQQLIEKAKKLRP